MSGTYREGGFIKLKRQITISGTTQRSLSGKLGISTQALNNKLAGRVPWRFKEVFTIGRELSIPQSELLSYFPEELCK